MKSLALESGIQLKECGISLTIGLRNPESSVELEAWNSESTGAFLWYDPDQNQLSEISRIMVDQMN